VGELFVGRQELAGIDESRTAEPVQIRRHDECREALAEAGRDVEGSRGTVTKQADAVERITQFGQLFVDEGADPASVPRTQKVVDR